MNTKATLTSITEFIIPYINLDNNISVPGLKLSDKIKAQMLSIDEDKYRKIISDKKESARQVALELLKDDEILHFLNELPFKDHQKIVVYGDSASNAIGGWVDVLSYVFELGTELDINVVNSSIPQANSSQLLQQFGTKVLAEKPDWVIINIGLWDSIRMNYAADRPLVSVTEFWENIQSMKNACLSLKNNNPIIWMPPSFVIEEAVSANPLINGSFFNSDIKHYQEVVRDKNGILIDPFSVRFGETPKEWHYASDGIHYSDSGNSITVKTLLSSLANVKK